MAETTVVRWWRPLKMDGRPKKYTYFVQHQGSGPIRIGYSANPWSQAHEMQTCSPYSLKLIGAIWSTSELPKWFEDRFVASRISGLWYVNSDELCGYIRGLVASERTP